MNNLYSLRVIEKYFNFLFAKKIIPLQVLSLYLLENNINHIFETSSNILSYWVKMIF